MCYPVYLALLTDISNCESNLEADAAAAEECYQYLAYYNAAYPDYATCDSDRTDLLDDLAVYPTGTNTKHNPECRNETHVSTPTVFSPRFREDINVV